MAAAARPELREREDPAERLEPADKPCGSHIQEAVCGAERAVGDGRGGGGRARGGGKPGLSGAAWGGGAYGERRRCGRRTRGAPGGRPDTAERSGVPRGRVGGGSEWRTRSATRWVGVGWP